MPLDHHNSTRTIDTLAGPKPYLELIPDLALGVEGVMKRLAEQPEKTHHFSFAYLLDLHRNAFGHLVGWAGQLRAVEVQVGLHFPPHPNQLPELLRNFGDDLEYRASQLDDDRLDPVEVAELFAFSEGRFLHIHPFRDFNGRVARLLSWSIVLRLRLPAHLELVTPDGDVDARKAFFEALAAWDRHQFGPLTDIWRDRLSRI